MARPRLLFTENDKPDSYKEVAQRYSLDADQLRRTLLRWDSAVWRRLRLHPLGSTENRFQVTGVAGIVPLSDFDLEIRPKFLTRSRAWHEDLYRLLILGRTASIHLDLGVAAQPGDSPIGDLIARSLLAVLRKASARGRIRVYRESERRDWNWSGDFAPEELCIPHAEGLLQKESLLSSDNPFNSRLVGALQRLSNQVSTFRMKELLLTEAAELEEQTTAPTSRLHRLPIHYRAYAPALTLADMVNRGTGLDPSGGDLEAIGFVVDMVREWQGFVGWMARAALFPQLQAQLGYTLTLQKEPATQLAPRRFVYPDWLATRMGRTPIVIDAKYKSVLGHSSISSGDLYQMLAFLEATEASLGILVYPSEEPAGQVTIFDEVHVSKRPPSRVILGVAAGLAGIGHRNASDSVTDAFRQLLSTRLPAA